MKFNFRGFFRFIYKSLFESKGTNYQLTAKRFAWLSIFLILYPCLELVTWFGFLLDEIFFRGYRKVEIKEPVFILGNPRSGTTLLQRLLARDGHNFHTMKTWEIVLAPSISMRKIIHALSWLDRRTGGLIHKGVAQVEKNWQAENVVHKIALQAPEEDEYLLIHSWSTLKIWLYMAMLDEAGRYTYFDTRMPETEKQRIMSFYKRCLKRYLYEQGGEGKHYLAKNPHFTPMIDTLYHHFPDAKIIYLVRNPLDVIPSNISLKEQEWQLLGDPVEAYASRDYILEMAKHWYNYPLERLQQTAPDGYKIINFNTMVGDVGATVAEAYAHFGLEIRPEFDEILREATRKARRYKSEHEYSLQEMGLEQDQLEENYKQVFERFDFSPKK